MMTMNNSTNTELVINLLKKAKFAHLATANPQTNQPNVSLMNYVYLDKLYLQDGLDSNKINNSHVLFSVNKSATNFENIKANPKVSILIHDWVTQDNDDSSSLLQLLTNINQNELSTISATLNGEARLITDDKAETYYRDLLLANYPKSKVFIKGKNNVCFIVNVEHYKVVDKNNVKESSS